MINFSMIVFIVAMIFGTVENSTRSSVAGGIARALLGLAGVCFAIGVVGMFAATKQ